MLVPSKESGQCRKQDRGEDRKRREVLGSQSTSEERERIVGFREEML